MSEEDFLKRWSRRKQEAKVAEEPPPLPASDADAPTSEPGTVTEPEIDLEKLPALDSITAVTDVTAFLRKGIPAELSRAALRRAWAADPAIRDFVGLAENAWDFTDPGAMAGFGELQGTPEQIAAMVERVMGAARETAEELASELLPSGEDEPKVVREVDASESTAAAVVNAQPLSSEITEPEAIAAVQPEDCAEDDDVVPFRRRAHGGALPT